MALPEKEIRKVVYEAVGFESNKNVSTEDHLYIFGSQDNGLT